VAQDGLEADRYWEVTVLLAPAATEAVANFLWDTGAVGLVEEVQEAFLVLRAFFPPGGHGQEMPHRLADYLSQLRRLAVAVGPGTISVTPVADQRWDDAWRSHFRPLRIGRRLLVCPPWDVPPPSELAGDPSAVVIIEPGPAFGTGGHASTRTCLELLERALLADRSRRVLDVGTGSGILAIAAARLGAPEVIAIDSDPDAVRAAQENALRNGVETRVRVALTPLAALADPAADLVLANLLGSMLVAHAHGLGRACRTPGRLIAGGLLVHEVPAIVAAFVVEGFRMVEMIESEGWAALLLLRDVEVACAVSSSDEI
jgi:ribosomal protein L11 methyltransferase